MVIQLEDCIDVMDALFSRKADGSDLQMHMNFVPNTTVENSLVREYDYCMLFDHSCGHDRLRPDGLSVIGLTRGPSATARLMRDSKIVKKEGYLGPYSHPNVLQVGDVQRMVFSDDDEGPVEWSERERQNKYDVIEGFKMVEKNVDELCRDLEEKNVDSKGVKAKLKERCKSCGIATEKQVPKLKTKGYVGKAKGVFQILWETGWIDPSNKGKYSMDGPMDESTEKRLDEYSLNFLIRQREDFMHEKTLLQHNREALGCIIDRSPKCTPEIAGDGIEFDWAMSKLWYRKISIVEKKGKDKFVACVRKALSKDVVTIERTRHFSRRARLNMVGYYRLEKDEKATTPTDLQKFRKKHKSHTNMADELYGYISNKVNKLLGKR